MNRNIIFIIYLLIAAAISSTAFFFFPDAKQAHLEIGLAIAFAIGLTLLGAVWNFLIGVRTFRPKLKAAYIFLAVGLLVYTSVLLTPSLTIFPIVTDVLLKLPTEALNIAIVVAYVLGSLSMYVGMRTFAKLLTVRHFFNSLPVAFGTAVIVGALAAAVIAFTLLKGQALRDQWLSDVIYGSVAGSAIFGLAATVLAMKMRQAVGVVYKSSMTWMTLALASFVFALFNELVVKNLLIDSAYVSTQFVLWPYLLNGILFLRAGLAFQESGRDAVRLPAQASYIDVVTGVSQMVSQPAAIDKALDKVRAITASQSSPDTLSSSDKATLLDTYLYLEHYLVNDEPVHRLAKERLRDNLPESFLSDLRQREGAASSSPAQ